MININNVYQTVLVLANKDNRGYITPAEFNRMADQAQNEIFEGYFVRESSYEMTGGMESDFSNPVLNLSERINTFYKSDTPTIANGIFPFPSDLRQLGIVSINGVNADLASHEDIKYINLSPLTYPVATQPVYTLQNRGVKVYPSTITTGVELEYLKNPVRPKWGYVMPTPAQIASGVPNEPIYDATQFDPATDSYDTPAKSYNFELSPAEYAKIIVMILAYAGITIKQGDVTGFAQGKEAQISQTEQ